MIVFSSIYTISFWVMTKTCLSEQRIRKHGKKEGNSLFLCRLLCLRKYRKKEGNSLFLCWLLCLRKHGKKEGKTRNNVNFDCVCESIRAGLLSNGVVVMAVAGKVTLGGAQPYS